MIIRLIPIRELIITVMFFLCQSKCLQSNHFWVLLCMSHCLPYPNHVIKQGVIQCPREEKSFAFKVTISVTNTVWLSCECWKIAFRVCLGWVVFPYKNQMMTDKAGPGERGDLVWGTTWCRHRLVPRKKGGFYEFPEMIEWILLHKTQKNNNQSNYAH